MRRREPSLCRPLALLTLGLIATVCPADTVELRGGGHLTGEVDRTSEEGILIINVDDEVTIRVKESRVLRVIDSDQLNKYREFAGQAGNDANRHYQLARWILGQRYFPGDASLYKTYHMERAIELDPDHKEARASLGYKDENGEWIKTSDLMRKRGMVQSGGWKLPEQVADERLAKDAETKAKQWNRDLALMLRAIDKPDTVQKIRDIKDPLAAGAIATQLNEPRVQQPQKLRLLWVKLLGGFKNDVSVRALVYCGIEDSDVVVRESALEELKKFGSDSAVATYLPMLKSKSNKQVNRAARALSWFPDPELAMTYVDALETTHIKTVGGGPATNAGFTQDGSGSFSTGGGKPKQIPYNVRNPAVLALLTKIEPEENYGMNEDAWRRHFARQRNAYHGDLRRDK